MKFAFRHLFAALGLLTCLACSSGSTSHGPVQDGDVAEEAESESDRDDAESVAEEDAEVEDADGDWEAESEPEVEPDEDLTIDPDPNWEKELDTEPNEAIDPNPSYVVIQQKFPKSFVPLNDDDSWIKSITGTNKSIIVVTAMSRILAFDGQWQLQWEYMESNQPQISWDINITPNNSIFFFAVRYTTIDNEPTIAEHLLIVLGPDTGEPDEYNLTKAFGISDTCIRPNDSTFQNGNITDDWVVVVAIDYCDPANLTTENPTYYLWGISRLDKKLKWRQPYHNGWIYTNPNGSFWNFTFSGSPPTMTYIRYTPLGEKLPDKQIAFPEDVSGPQLLSNGTMLFFSAANVYVVSADGEHLWHKATLNKGNPTFVDDDDSLIANDWQHYRFYRYAPNGDYLHEIKGPPMEYYYAWGGPYKAPKPWRWNMGDKDLLKPRTPYSGLPEAFPNEVTCNSKKEGSPILTTTAEPVLAEGEDWILRRVKDDSTYSCPLKPDIGNPFDSWAANAWSDATLDVVWIGGYDALWRYDTSAREAQCFRIGNIEVITGHINQGVTTLAYVMDGQLFIGPADGSATTSHALPDDVGTILSLAIDADSIAIGGPKGLWVRALTTETWTKIESCCGAGLQVNQSGLFMDGGTLWAGAFGGVYRIDPVTQSCEPQCLATEPYSNFEIYGRSKHGVWVAWQEDQSQGQQPAYQGNTVGECLDNGVWFPQLTTSDNETVIGAVKTPEGLLALKLEPKDLSTTPGVLQCESVATVQVLPEPIGRSSAQVLPLGASYPSGMCGWPGYLGQKIIPTKNSYFASGLWMEALRKQSVP